MHFFAEKYMTLLKILPDYFCEEYAITCLLNQLTHYAAATVQATRNFLGFVSRKRPNVFVEVVIMNKMNFPDNVIKTTRILGM